MNHSFILNFIEILQDQPDLYYGKAKLQHLIRNSEDIYTEDFLKKLCAYLIFDRDAFDHENIILGSLSQLKNF